MKLRGPILIILPLQWAPMKLNEKKLDLLAKDIQVKQGSQTARRSPTDVNRQVVLPSRNTTRFSLQWPGTMARANFVWDKVSLMFHSFDLTPMARKQLRKAQRATFPAHKYRFPFIQFPTSPMPAGTRILLQEHNLHSLELEYRYRPCPRCTMFKLFVCVCANPDTAQQSIELSKRMVGLYLVVPVQEEDLITRMVGFYSVSCSLLWMTYRPDRTGTES